MKLSPRIFLIFNKSDNKFLSGFKPLTYKSVWTDNIEHAKVYTSDNSVKRGMNSCGLMDTLTKITISNQHSNSLNLKSF